MSRSVLTVFLFLLCVGVPGVRAADFSDDPHFLFTLAQTLRYESDYQAAAETFARAVRIEPDEPYLRLEYADFLYQLGRLVEAGAQASAARRLLPEDPQPVRLLARIELRGADRSGGGSEDALRYFDELRRLAPDDLEARVSAGRLLLALSRHDEAAALLEEAFEIRPNDMQISSLLVEALENATDKGLAERGLRSLLDEYPGLLRARLGLAGLLSETGRHADAVDILEGSLPRQKDSVEVLRQLAFELYRSDSWERSLAIAEKWLEKSPTELPARYLYGLSMASMGRYAEAENVLAPLFNENPDSLDIGRLLAEVLERQGKPEEARELLIAAAERVQEADADKALGIRLEAVDVSVRSEDWRAVLDSTGRLLARNELESDTDLKLLRAQALYELGRSRESLELYDELAKEPDVYGRAMAKKAEALHRLGRNIEANNLFDQLGKSDDVDQVLLAARTLYRLELYEASIPLWIRAKAEQSESLNVQFWLGAAYERSGRTQDAVIEFRALLERDDHFAPALNYLGYMYAERGENLDEAMKLVRRAVSLEPGNGAYVDSLGWAYYRLGRYEEAKGHLLKAAKLVGDDAVVHEHLGDVYSAIGDKNEAADAYRKALELDHENAAEIEEKLKKLVDDG